MELKGTSHLFAVSTTPSLSIYLFSSLLFCSLLLLLPVTTPTHTPLVVGKDGMDVEVWEGDGKLLGSISSLGHDNSTESNDCEPVGLEGRTGHSGLQQPASPHLENVDGLVCEMEEKEEEEEAEISPFTSSMSISGIKLDKATQAALNRMRVSHKRHTLLSSSGHERLAL